MPTLQAMLNDSDPGRLIALAQIWKIDAERVSSEELPARLLEVMLDKAQVERVWDQLDERMRAALQMLVSAERRQMSQVMFERIHGEIRKMGRGAIERELPHKQPASQSEGLFYRGFIGLSFDRSEGGMRPIVYVPSDLVDVLPLHKTSYAGLADEPLEAGPGAPLALDDVRLEALDDEMIDAVVQADTSIVDDMTTLLAYLQCFGARVDGMNLASDDADAILSHLLVQDRLRLNFLFGVGISARLITSQEGRAYPLRSEVRPWLSAPRPAQLRALLDAWTNSRAYLELWQVPGLYPDDGGCASYDPVHTRSAIMGFLRELAPPESWWALEDLLSAVHQAEPDFQRVDYESWYIRNEHDEYLTGFESWDAVEGSLIAFMVTGPLHWLCLLDLSDDEEAARFNVFGLAAFDYGAWPTINPAADHVIVEPDGSLIASRRVPSFDRFQLARFTSWQGTRDSYHYRLDADSIQRAAGQGITTEHIAAFLKRQLGDADLPEAITRLLANWTGGAAGDVSFEHLLVLRTTSIEVMDRIYDDPPFRRFLGARLGPMACIIRADQPDALKQALGEAGIQVEVLS